MKIKFRKAQLGNIRLAVLDTIRSVVEEYQAQGYRLTLRQLYYQLVSRDMIPNSDQSYKRIGKILTEARYGGLVDWSAIEDRVRVPKLPYWAHDIPDAINDTVKDFRLNRQRGQNTYVEVWVEKDALSSVLSRVTSEYHVRLMVNRGYSSASAMFEAYQRFRVALNSGASHSVILYMGDHDPSGLDMIRDVEERMKEMLERDNLNHDIEVKAIALTRDQIREYNPPPNPAKLSDSRAKDYVSLHGNQSWELDALRPEVLNQILTDAIEAEIDLDLFEKVKDEEDVLIGKLIDFSNSFKDDKE